MRTNASWSLMCACSGVAGQGGVCWREGHRLRKPPAEKKAQKGSGLEINIVYFENVSGAVLRPHMIDY